MHRRIPLSNISGNFEFLTLTVSLALFKFPILADIFSRAIAGQQVTITHNGKDTKLDSDLDF